MVICDLLLLVIFVLFTYDKMTEVRYCSPKLFWVGIGYMIYFGFWGLRNCLVLLIAWFQKDPSKSGIFQRMGWAVVDYFLLTAFMVWSTIVLFNNETYFCRIHVSEASDWWYACLICMIIGWIYDFTIFIVCSIVGPIFAGVLCYLHASGRNTEEERQRAMRERLPVV